jgi:hypothetical protein
MYQAKYREYEHRCFSEKNARELNNKLVTVTTHDDPETEQPGETYGPFAFHIPGKQYPMLLNTEATSQNIADLVSLIKMNLFFWQIAEVEIA